MASWRSGAGCDKGWICMVESSCPRGLRPGSGRGPDTHGNPDWEDKIIELVVCGSFPPSHEVVKAGYCR